jgi:hypothetical protein
MEDPMIGTFLPSKMLVNMLLMALSVFSLMTLLFLHIAVLRATRRMTQSPRPAPPIPAIPHESADIETDEIHTWGELAGSASGK